MRDRDRDRALARVADAVNDWAGGTRIGESFRDFNLHWARRTLRTSGIVIVVSDGWDRGDPMLVATETARLRRNCHRLVWLNPLAGTPGYEPLAGGMRAAYPYIDDFLPAGTVASLERLGEILAGVRTSDVRRGGGAAARPMPGRERLDDPRPAADAALGGPRPARRRPAADRSGRRRDDRRRQAGGSVADRPDGATAAPSPIDRRRVTASPPAMKDTPASKDVRDALESWRADGVGVGRAVVVRTFGSAPRPEGAVLLRADDGRIAGSVSGGCVEGAAAEEIERARRDGHAG